jgi:carbon-monoxide dehydrogenase medium subunit
LHRFEYYSPETVVEAVEVLRTKGEGGKVLAGGTDLVPQMKERGRHPKYLVSLRRVREMQGVESSPAGGLTVGAATKFSILQRHPDVINQYPIIAQTARLIGSIQTQNLATIGGNVCNAAPSADAVPAFIVLDATATIQGPRGSRTLPLTTLLLGPGQISLSADELLTQIDVPLPRPHSTAVYLRHVPRKELDISIAGVAAYVQLDDDLQRVVHARICLTSVGPTAVSAVKARDALIGQSPAPDLLEHVGELAASEAQPISDHRGSVAFRRALVQALTARAIAQAVASIQ